MKKMILMLALVLAALTVFTACGKPQVSAVCSECLEQKLCREYIVTGIFGDKRPHTICDDCIDNARSLAKIFGMSIE